MQSRPAPASVLSIQIASPSSAGCNLTIDTTNGNPIPLGGLTYSGGGGLIKKGSGSATLSTANSFTGGVAVTGGKLIVTTPAALATGSNLTVGANAAKVFGAVVPADAASVSAMASAAAVATTEKRTAGGAGLLPSTDSAVRPTAAFTFAPAKGTVFRQMFARNRPEASAAIVGPKVRKLALPEAWPNMFGADGQENDKTPGTAALDALFAAYAQQE